MSVWILIGVTFLINCVQDLCYGSRMVYCQYEEVSCVIMKSKGNFLIVNLTFYIKSMRKTKIKFWRLTRLEESINKIMGFLIQLRNNQVGQLQSQKANIFHNTALQDEFKPYKILCLVSSRQKRTVSNYPMICIW